MAREVRRQLPGANIEFYGDNGRAPYGHLQKEIIANYARQILNFLAGKNIDIAIIACNTATVASWEEVMDEYPFPVLGVVNPGVRGALAATRNKKVGVIATEFTIKSEAHKSGIQAMDPEVEVFGQACPKFTLLVEAGKTSGPEVEEAVSGYLATFKGKGIDTLILGCTHYPVLVDTIRRYVDPDVTIVDPAVKTVAEAKEILEQKGLVADNSFPVYNFYTSGDPELFMKVGTTILGWPIEEVEKVVLG
ncbi:MAG TPA: glutamate racemase [Firmicutes bacterium]|nr:glutamate racemase [Bacillota bacterium]